jgi:Ca-activated chloride channel family protein
VSVALNAGVPIDSLKSMLHAVDVERPSASIARVTLRDQATLPNKDFILRWDVAGGKIQDALLTHRGDRGGFFTFLLQPPERPTAAEITPKEIVFVIDTSGSMSGFPIEKSKEVIKLALDNLNKGHIQPDHIRRDHAHPFPQPVPATPNTF